MTFNSTIVRIMRNITFVLILINCRQEAAANCYGVGPQYVCISKGSCISFCTYEWVPCGFPGSTVSLVSKGIYATETIKIPTVKPGTFGTYKKSFEDYVHKGLVAYEDRYDYICGVNSIIYFTHTGIMAYKCDAQRPIGNDCDIASIQRNISKESLLAMLSIK